MVLCFAFGCANRTKEKSSPKEGENKLSWHRISSIFFKRFTLPWLKTGFFYNLTSYANEEKGACKVAHALRDEIIKERKAIRSQLKAKKTFSGDKHKLPLLDVLLDEELSDDEICSQVDTFLAGGHETSAAALNWCLFVFAQHKDVQINILKEFRELVASTENPYSLASINKLQYLERCIKEVLRLYAPFSFIRRALKEPTKMREYCLPKGTNVLVFLPAVHKNPQVYPEPEKFDPDRFLLDNSSKRHPYSYIPFSAGPRNCIGQRYALVIVKIILIKILEAYEVCTSMRPADLKLYSGLVLRNENGMKISFQKRSTQQI